MIKYIVHPGYVRSKNDRDKHFISYDRLIELYGVNPKECVDARSEYSRSKPCEDCIDLKPKYDGNYTLPKVKP